MRNSDRRRALSIAIILGLVVALVGSGRSARQAGAAETAAYRHAVVEATRNPALNLPRETCVVVTVDIEACMADQVIGRLTDALFRALHQKEPKLWDALSRFSSASGVASPLDVKQVTVALVYGESGPGCVIVVEAPWDTKGAEDFLVEQLIFESGKTLRRDEVAGKRFLCWEQDGEDVALAFLPGSQLVFGHSATIREILGGGDVTPADNQRLLHALSETEGPGVAWGAAVVPAAARTEFEEEVAEAEGWPREFLSLLLEAECFAFWLDPQEPSVVFNAYAPAGADTQELERHLSFGVHQFVEFGKRQFEARRQLEDEETIEERFLSCLVQTLNTASFTAQEDHVRAKCSFAGSVLRDFYRALLAMGSEGRGSRTPLPSDRPRTTQAAEVPESTLQHSQREVVSGPTEAETLEFIRRKLEADEVEIDSDGESNIDLNTKTYYRRWWGIYLWVQLSSLNRRAIRAEGSAVVLECQRDWTDIREGHWIGRDFDDPDGRYSETVDLHSIRIQCDSRDTAEKVAKALRHLMDLRFGEEPEDLF